MRRVASERLRAASLVEAVVAAVVLLVVFAATLKLLPRRRCTGNRRGGIPCRICFREIRLGAVAGRHIRRSLRRRRDNGRRRTIPGL